MDWAKCKADEIRTEGNAIANRAYESALETVEEELKRLEKLYESTIRFEEEKSLTEVFLKILLYFQYKKQN